MTAQHFFIHKADCKTLLLLLLPSIFPTGKIVLPHKFISAFIVTWEYPSVHCIPRKQTSLQNCRILGNQSSKNGNVSAIGLWRSVVLNGGYLTLKTWSIEAMKIYYASIAVVALIFEERCFDFMSLKRCKSEVLSDSVVSQSKRSCRWE